jgi:hypothetical protein
MRAITIGLNAAGQELSITPELRQSTHMHIIGGSGTGKSKFLEWMMRKDIREGHGFCLIDWHGTLYQDIVRYCAHLDVGLGNDFRKVVLINPSKSDYITGFNPFMNQGDDISVQVSRRIAATIRPWGITDTNQMPTFENVTRAIYTFAVEQRQTLPNAAHLLEFDRPELREYAANVVTDPEGRKQLRRLVETKTFKEWREFVLSTENRLGRFLGSKTVRRFMGLRQCNIDLLEAMDEGKIVLVNLGYSGYLDRESARVFASLFLNEFFETAMQRATSAQRGKKPRTFSLYLDEFQEYITEDIGAMLDQVRKGGLHMVLAHQHLGHLADDQRLLQSILTNARIRAVFGGLPYTDACLLANEMFLPDLNTRQIKKAYYHTTHLYEEQQRVVKSQTRGSSVSESSSMSSGSGFGNSAGSGASVGPGAYTPTGRQEGWFSEGESLSGFTTTSEARGKSNSEAEGESYVPVWVPIPTQELGSETEWSREDKVSRVAEMLKTQQQRHCFIKLDTERTQPLRIPFVKDYSLSEGNLLQYQENVYRAQNAIPAHHVDRLLEENATQFLNGVQEAAGAIPASEMTVEEPPRAAPAPKSKAASKAKATKKEVPKKTKRSIFEDANIDPIGRE